MKIQVFLYNQTYIGVGEQGRTLLCHLSGIPAFNAEKLDEIKLLAKSHGWDIEIVPKPPE